MEVFGNAQIEINLHRLGVTIGSLEGDGSAILGYKGVSRVVTLIIQSRLIFKAAATYSYRLSTKRAQSDQVAANGATIGNGAQFGFVQVGRDKLTPGTVFAAISNTSATPISGAFDNLPDGSTFTAGRNNYQVSYEERRWQRSDAHGRAVADRPSAGSLTRETY